MVCTFAVGYVDASHGRALPTAFGDCPGSCYLDVK
jgi:hypothetical protein